MTADAQGSAFSKAQYGKLPVVQAGLIRPLLTYADNAGATTQALLSRANLPGDLMSHPHRFVPAARWFGLFSDLVRESGQPDLGWQVAQRDGMACYSQELMRGISGAPTLLEAFRFVAKAQSKHCNCQFFTIRVIGEFGYIVQGDTIRCPGYEQRNAFRTANIIGTIRAFLGDAWQPDLIVTQTSLDALPLTTMLDGIRVVRREAFSAVRIPRAQLITPPERELRGSYTGSGETVADIPNQIRQVLSSYSRLELPCLRQIATLMNTSERSLQRRLRELHTSYSQLAREATFERARELLGDSDLPITEIAHEVGYDDSSHFSRMFRTVGGVSPREFRLRLEEAPYQSRTA